MTQKDAFLRPFLPFLCNFPQFFFLILFKFPPPHHSILHNIYHCRPVLRIRTQPLKKMRVCSEIQIRIQLFNEYKMLFIYLNLLTLSYRRGKIYIYCDHFVLFRLDPGLTIFLKCGSRSMGFKELISKFQILNTELYIILLLTNLK